MAAPSLTYTLTNGATADASQVMQDLNDILNGITDGTKDLSINALTLAGTLTANGNINLGNATADTLTVTALLGSGLTAKTDATYDLGTSSLGWQSLYMGRNSQRVRIIPSASTSASWTLTLPTTGGTNNYIATTDGSGGMSWTNWTNSAWYADGSNAGTLSATTQTIGGAKTFTGTVTLNGAISQSISNAHAYVASFTQTAGANSDDNGLFIAIQGTGGKALRIDTTGVNTPLIVNGNGQINVWTGNWGTGGTAVGVSSSTLTLSPSARRYKENIQPLATQIDSARIYDLVSTVFDYKRDGRHSFGLIADDVYKLLPCLVHCEPDENGVMRPESVAYDHLSVLLLEEMKKLKAKLD